SFAVSLHTVTTHSDSPALHDALPISMSENFMPTPAREKRHTSPGLSSGRGAEISLAFRECAALLVAGRTRTAPGRSWPTCASSRSEEHTSELQSRDNLACRLLLDNKK